jgi:hypothetical protein
MNDLDKLLNEEGESFPETKMDIEAIKNKVPEFSSQKLCEMIVCSRYFNFEPQIIVVCMEELAKRRLAGDAFDFEKNINETQGKLPPIQATLPDLSTVLKQAISLGKK